MLQRLWRKTTPPTPPTPPPFGQNRNPEFAAALEHLAAVSDRIEKSAVWHEKLANRNMREFYGSGFLLIALSVSLPFISALDFADKDTVVSGVALAVTFLTAVVAFNRWEVSWSEHRQTQLELRYQISLWRVQIIAAANAESAKDATASAIAATSTLIEEAKAAQLAGARRIFGELGPPKLGG